MNTKKLVLCGVLSAAALGISIAEAQIPVLIAVPGIKLGLANIVTLIAIPLLGRRRAGAVLLVRIVLGAVFAGTGLSFLYSAAGGACCFALLCALSRFFTGRRFWALGVLGAIAHNSAQLLCAVLVMNSRYLLWYAPWLLGAAVLTGALTGLAAQLALPRLKRALKFTAPRK